MGQSIRIQTSPNLRTPKYSPSSGSFFDSENRKAKHLFGVDALKAA